MEAATDLRNLADTHLHRYHSEVLASRRVAISAREHFDRQIAPLTALEESIRAKFDRPLFEELPEDRDPTHQQIERAES